MLAPNIQARVDTPNIAVGMYAGPAILTVSNGVSSSPFSVLALSSNAIAFGVALTAVTVVTMTPAAPTHVKIVDEFRFRNF